MPDAAAVSVPLTPIGIQTFADEGDRKRLSEVALKAFRNIAEHWSLTAPEAASLLGVSVSTWERMRRPGRAASLNQDQLTRVSAMVGIYKGLHLLFADDMSDRWMQLENSGPLFGRRTPVQAMIEGGIPAMLDVRRYVDAVRGGL